jgi:F-type H+-transporting ATPase subunit a
MLAMFFLAEEATKTQEAKGGHHVVWIAEQVNHILSPVVFPIQKAIMQGINPNWQGDPNNAIPEHITLVLISVLFCTLGLYLFRGKLSVDNPSNRQQIVEGIVLQVRDLLDQIVGPFGRRYLAVIGSFAIFILISNLMGIIPGLKAATASINVTLALGIMSFLYYISRGFMQQGLGYLKHFMGGPELMQGFLILFGMLIFFIEIGSNLFRPFTLGLRLFINIYADEQLADIGSGLVPVLLPAGLLVLAVFVSFVQTFIFVVLSCVYLSEGVPHDDHHEGHDDHAQAAH